MLIEITRDNWIATNHIVKMTITKSKIEGRALVLVLSDGSVVEIKEHLDEILDDILGIAPPAETPATTTTADPAKPVIVETRKPKVLAKAK